MVMEGESWWPQGVAVSSFDEALNTGQLNTKWGVVPCWDIQKALTSEWWNQPKEGVWGEFDDIKPSSIEVIHRDGNQTLLRLDESYIALAYSIPTSNRTSSLHQKPNLKSALESTKLLMPIGGFLTGLFILDK